MLGDFNINAYVRNIKKKIAMVVGAILVVASMSLGNIQSASSASTKTRVKLPQDLQVKVGAETKNAGLAPTDAQTLTAKVEKLVVGVW